VPRIHILVDDRIAETVPHGLQAEHGFAAVVDGVLFDTGQTGMAVENARRLGVATEYDKIVLSHGHYDHTGGLPAFLEGAETVYAHPDALRPKVREGKSIGISYQRPRIEADAEILTHEEPIEVAPGIHALGEIPREYPDNPTGQKQQENGTLVADNILDDQSLVVETESGIALVCGCCHAGLRNTVDYAETVTGREVHAIVGGTHLKGSEAAEIHEIADWLGDRIDLFAPSHCTGAQGERIFASRFPDAYEVAGVGTKFDLA
jgi:7,8-dihydropterin-6-yl-methyl-4-(beta-D-ribofuranosyl)aminobenzene 5'-phosphate synthase